jgi:hypothetical protein
MLDKRSPYLIGHSLLTTIASNDAAIESHASSIQRACPVMRASPAPMVAIKSAKAASAQTMRRKALSNRLLVPSCCQCGHCLSTASPLFDFECPVVVLRYAHIANPVVSSYSFETLLAAILLLLAGNLFKGF